MAYKESDCLQDEILEKKHLYELEKKISIQIDNNKNNGKTRNKVGLN